MEGKAGGTVGYMDYTAVFETVAFKGLLHRVIVFVGVGTECRDLLQTVIDASVCETFK